MPGAGAPRLQWALMLPMAMPSLHSGLTSIPTCSTTPGRCRRAETLFGWQSPADYWFPAIPLPRRCRLGAGLVLFPYVYLLARASFLEQSVSLIHSSRLLGLHPGRAFSSPQPAPGPPLRHHGGASLVAMETLADFATVHFLPSTP